ncbi:MAG TPA: universal stress protein [Aeromicrobium sp.]|nr:universal stress protein [Aeromicrobium sp.]
MSTNRIVVGLDDSPAGRAALAWAAAEAELRGAELKIFHVWQIDMSIAMAATEIPWKIYEDDARTSAATLLEETIGSVDAAGNPRAVEVVQGAPGPVLVEASRDADLLVVGTQVHTGISRVLFGSVSHYCLTHAASAVVAVPAVA